MGDNVVQAQAREIMARFESEVHGLLEMVKAENARLEARVRELEDEIGKEREARRKEEANVEAYRRDYQTLWVKCYPPTEEDLEFWRNAKPSDFPLSWKDIEAVLDEFETENDDAQRKTIQA